MDVPCLTFTNPATGEQFGQVEMASKEAIRQAREEMRTAAKVWSAKPLSERIRILKQFQEMLIDAKDEISAMINMDTGKSRQDALIELFMTVDFLHTYLRNAPRWLRREKIPTGLYIFKRAYKEYRPHGVVAVIAPWNYPFALSMPPVLSALLAGNTVLLKPSEVTPATGVLIENLFKRLPELAPYVRVLHGDGRVGAEMVQSHPDYIFLTGSTPTGKKVLAAAAEYLIPVGSELGGKDAMIVLEDADLDQAARWGVWGANFNAGQTCMAVERVYVLEEVYDEFVRLAVMHTQKLKMGFNTDLNSPYYIGPITDSRQLKTLHRHLDDALQKGAQVLCGGGQEGNYFEPTVMVAVDHDMLLMQEETFGPILPIMKVKDVDEAVRLANDSRYGLGASVWSANIERALKIAHRLNSATVLVNDTVAHFAVPEMPFGGIKESGYGRTHGKEGLLQFTQPYSYVYGNPPFAWDVATIARQPGRYQFISRVMRLAFGSPRQRLEPVVEVLEEVQGKVQEALPKAAQPRKQQWGWGALGVLGALSALAGVVFVSKRGRSNQ